MSFAAQRQTALQGGPLSTRFFGETVEFTPLGGEAQDVLAKITHEQAGPQSGSRSSTPPARPGTVDELERILVTVSRNAAQTGSLPTRPSPGDNLVRAEAVDADRRPFAFAGEVQFEGDQHAVYVFQRPRRFVQGRQ